MKDYIELEHTTVGEGKARAKESLFDLRIPSYKPVLDERWRAQYNKDYHPDSDMNWLVTEILRIVPSLSDITTQRAIYYMLRGQYPNRKFRTNELGSNKFYGQLTGDGMKYVQLASGVTMQSLGIWAAPKGYIAGDGKIYTQRRGSIPLTAQPTLNFDLADAGSYLSSNAHKVIHFEKDAGFSSIVAGDMPKYIEAVFSTAQGQLTEAANKFLREAENWGLQVYSVHDGDAYGMQMQMLYGLASKSNCYMPSEFYPTNSKSLGFFPSIAQILNLPPEKMDEERRLEDYLNVLLQEKPEFQHEIDVSMGAMQKWEFQALNAIDEKAPHIYIIEGLRARNDEIKHVPDGKSLRDKVITEAEDSANSTVEDAIYQATERALAVIREEIQDKIREALSDKIKEFNQLAEEAIGKIAEAPAYNFREAVKKKLVENPSDYWTTAINRIARDSFNFKFDIDAKVDVVAEVSDVKVDIAAEATSPEEPEIALDKDDIVRSIEKRIIRQAPNRDKVVNPIREAFEQVFGEPDKKW